MTQAAQGNQATQASSAFIAYPPQAAFNRTVPKSKIYEHSGANARLRELFVKQVESIVWQYKLAPETINLPATPAVPEIEVFAIQLKTPELHRDVLRCIDGAIPLPIIFELTFAEKGRSKTQVVASYKIAGEPDTNRRLTSADFASPWLPSDVQRHTMPVALDLAGLYEQLLHRLIPYPKRPNESLPELIARVELIRAKARDVEKTAGQLAKEKQFNRKVVINANLRTLKTELDQLSG